jgi:hypothetical protein
MYGNGLYSDRKISLGALLLLLLLLVVPVSEASASAVVVDDIAIRVVDEHVVLLLLLLPPIDDEAIQVPVDGTVRPVLVAVAVYVRANAVDGTNAWSGATPTPTAVAAKTAKNVDKG